MATILLVDDNKDIHSFVRHHLAQAGHRLITATDSTTGRGLALGRRPEVILLDWMLPGRDGVALCQELKQDKRTCFVPIILLTVRASVADKIKGFEAGADEYLTKPFHPGELLARIAAALRLRTLQSELAKVETARQTLGTLSHHIRTAIQIIFSAAENFEPQDEEARAFQERMFHQARGINLVLDSLAEVISNGKLQVTTYPGIKEGILDIRQELALRLSSPPGAYAVTCLAAARACRHSSPPPRKPGSSRPAAS